MRPTQLNRAQHYFERIISLVPLPTFWRALVISIASYLIFALIALNDLANVQRTFLPVWQANFSLTLFLGILFGDIAFQDLRAWVKAAQKSLKPKRTEMSSIQTSVDRRLKSKTAHLFAFPFIVSGLAIAVGAAFSNRNILLTDGFTPVYVYAVMFELCIVMLDLLGGTGYWLMFIFYKASKDLSQLDSVDYCNVDSYSFEYLTRTIRKLSFFFFIIILSIMPSIAIVGIGLGGWYRWVTIAMGLILPSLSLFAAYFGPNLYLKRIIKRIRSCRSDLLVARINQLEELLYDEINNSENSKENQKIFSELDRLRKELDLVNRRRGDPFQFISVLEIGAAGLLAPIVTVIFQRYIDGLFK